MATWWCCSRETADRGQTWRAPTQSFLGAGIVGTSVALHLAKRGLSVALVDRRGPGEETCYGNTGVIVGASVFPTAFPRSLKKLIQVALKRAPEANYHWGDLPRSRRG